ncbi:MAG TPA: hypothetical protein PKM99_10225, partial [Thermotogota bacterium]|nr:hypothetical protein [Thermotogota bacterium]
FSFVLRRLLLTLLSAWVLPLDDMEPIHEGGEWKRSIARRVRRDKKNRSKKDLERDSYVFPVGAPLGSLHGLLTEHHSKFPGV